ncbi:acyl carrier protein [Methylococcus sp. EFPC2]|uniref:acyl carrier protein n=1 Tax=Methylococcus sp. EFPC2 TaxID=2812648 RepID=UPI0019675809|nr:acyl carrier protein [Methylococcus sp. EFPC2]QSA98856.1 acyl carrier protein [Methylococcus sp. EFPC2]
MQDRDEILNLLKDLIAEMFEISRDDVAPAASLSQDLDIDSIDAVDLMVKLRQVTGRRIQPEDFKSARTVQDVVDTIYHLYNA